MRYIFRTGLLTIIILSSFTSQAKNTLFSSSNKKATDTFTEVKKNIDLFSLPLTGNSRSWQLDDNENKNINVILDNVILPKGAWIETSTIEGKDITVYNNKSLYNGSKPQISMTALKGKGLIIKLFTPEKNPLKGHAVISRYRYLNQNTRQIIGEDQLKPAACYKTINPTFYAKSLAVTEPYGASGWNVVGGPYVITNAHVAGSAGNKIHNAYYNYESAACDDAKPTNYFIISSESVITAGADDDAAEDYSVYKMDQLAYNETGIKQLFGTLAINSDTPKNQLTGNVPVYIPQQPNAENKQIASLHDDGGPCHTLDGDKGRDTTLEYNCDTYGGSSGSPVLSQADNRVVALHRGTQSDANIGMLGAHLYDRIKEMIPTSNDATLSTTGEGRVMVRALNFYPSMPAAPIDLNADGAITLTSLYADRLKEDQHSTLFKAKVRLTNGNITDVNVRFSVTTPCGENSFSEAALCTASGKRILNSQIIAADNPTLENVFSGWVTLQISDSKGNRLHNLVMPLNYENNYDPFTSPFTRQDNVSEYTLTADNTLTTRPLKYKTNVGFVAVYDGQGPSGLTTSKTQYTPVKVQVKHKEDNGIYVIHLRGYRKTGCPPVLHSINSKTGCHNAPQPASFVLDYKTQDNASLPKGTYTGLLPLVAKSADSRHTANVASYLIHINITK